MVEENFELEWSEKLQNEELYICFWVKTFTTVEESFELEGLRMTEFLIVHE